MAFEFLGGGAHCGKPWDRFGAPYALIDCPDHVAGVNRARGLPLVGEPYHDPIGWPTFKDWPAPESLTHEGTYYRWLERSWRGGQRLFVNLLVENNQLCQLYPLPQRKNSCDDMDSIRLQAQRMYELQDYVDAQWGGPGEGWYRIVTDPWEARRVINDGKLAVVMGIETSVPFGCSFKVQAGEDVPDARCTKRSIDRQLAEVRALGVRQMELVNKFDNALSGVAGDAGSTGVVVNNANKLETGTYWDMRHCEPEVPGAHDNNQYALPEIAPEQQDALFGAIGQVYGQLGALPLYPPPDHCNRRGLTDLGAHLVDRLAQHGMLIDPDHMSVAARDTLLDQVEDRGYCGVISSHSWSTPDAYPRIYRLGGFIAPYAGDSTGFVQKWRRHLEWADDRYYFGIGYGADMNGLGAQGGPRGADVPNPVTYPFRGLGGVTIGRQHAGERVYDLNVDGVAQYGLYPDWIEDLRLVADAQRGDGDAIALDMARGAEAYLQTWERALGVAPDSCRNPGLRLRVATFRDRVEPGLTARGVLREVGQPFLRRDLTFTYCARTARDPDVRLTGRAGPAGRVEVGHDASSCVTPAVSASSVTGTLASKTPGSASVAPIRAASSSRSREQQHVRIGAVGLQHPHLRAPHGGREHRLEELTLGERDGRRPDAGPDLLRSRRRAVAAGTSAARRHPRRRPAPRGRATGPVAPRRPRAAATRAPRASRAPLPGTPRGIVARRRPGSASTPRRTGSGCG